MNKAEIYHGFISSNEFHRFLERKGREKKSWEFTLTSAALLDWAALAQDLSYKYPLAFVEMNGVHYVLAHKTLLTKADALGYRPPTGEAEILRILSNFEIYDIYKDSDKGLWVGWAQLVKKARWPEEFSKKLHVKVDMPVI